MGQSASGQPRPWEAQGPCSRVGWPYSAAQGSRSHPWRCGRSLHGDYEVHKDKVLGRGSNGTVVLRATSRAGARSCAVKTLHTAGASPDVQRRAEAEVRIMLSLDHPHVVRLYDVYFEQDGQVHLVMECCSGGELFFRITRQGALSEPEAATAVAQILRAVGYLHASGVAHRDLKPENFLYESKGPEAALRLIDFGFAKCFEPRKPMYRCCGSLMYVSPEVLSHEGYTHKCDMWSVGIIAYLLLMGQPPIHGNDRDLRRKIKAGNVDLKQRAMGRWSSLSQEATDFLKLLLVKDPEKRLSAHEMMFHPWLIRNAATSTTGGMAFTEPVVRSLEAYVRAPPLERAVLQVVAQELPGDAAPQLREAFLALDLANRGTLCVRDVQAAVLKACREEGAPLAEEEASALLSALADVWDDQVSYSSFLAAVLETSAASLDPSASQAAFRRLDLDSSGSLTVEDLQRSFGEAMADEAGEWVKTHSSDGSIGEVDAKAFVLALSLRSNESDGDGDCDKYDCGKHYTIPAAVSRMELEGVGPQSQDWSADIFLF